MDTYVIDSVDFTIFAPILIIIFAVLGWVMATGFGKTQYVRVIDVLLYGPYLLYLAFKETYTFTVGEKIFLLFLGATTISYNLRNFIGEL